MVGPVVVEDEVACRAAVEGSTLAPHALMGLIGINAFRRDPRGALSNRHSPNG
jgi:hypothetical protein